MVVLQDKLLASIAINAEKFFNQSLVQYKSLTRCKFFYCFVVLLSVINNGRLCCKLN